MLRRYQKTAEAWLTRLGEQRDEVLAIFARAHGAADALRWLLYAYREGQEWIVSHFLFERSA